MQACFIFAEWQHSEIVRLILSIRKTLWEQRRLVDTEQALRVLKIAYLSVSIQRKTQGRGRKGQNRANFVAS